MDMKKLDVCPINTDKFTDLMAKHAHDAGVNCVRLWEKAQMGEEIRPLAREFVTDRLEQCLAAWECAEGVWRSDYRGLPERDPLLWDWDEFLKELGVCLDDVI